MRLQSRRGPFLWVPGLPVCLRTGTGLICCFRLPGFEVPSASQLCDPGQVMKTLSSLRVGSCHEGKVTRTSQAWSES